MFITDPWPFQPLNLSSPLWRLLYIVEGSSRRDVPPERLYKVYGNC
ncbi:MAG: hypothetical protein ICV63_14080 [Coleofasciculus sp. Co-bin14]|nr:hypothetical protein [Coleofasciculus sp. Co-bin14]